MPRTARHSPGGVIFHVLNRGNARDQIFDQDSDYAAFEKVLAEPQEQVSVWILSENKPALCPWPIPRPADWVTRVNRALTKKEIEAVQTSVARGRPFGSELWQENTAKQLGLQSTFRSRGRPRKTKPETKTE